MKQGLTFTDVESNYILSMLTQSDVLPKNITIIIPEKDGTLALISDIEALRTTLTNGDIVAKKAESIGEFNENNIAMKDLSNVDGSNLPAAVVAALKGDKGDKGDQGDIGTLMTVGTGSPNTGTVGRNGVDKYLDSTTGDLFQRDGAGNWSLEMNIIGPQGIQGLQGDKGDKGDTGLQGIQGLKGDKGDKGDAGLTGATGPKGSTGSTGAPGATGPQGPTGATGTVAKTVSTAAPSGGTNGDTWFQY